MNDDDFARLMRVAWGWLAYVCTATTALLAALFASGLAALTPTTGTGMGLLAVFAVASISCWAYWRSETRGQP